VQSNGTAVENRTEARKTAASQRAGQNSQSLRADNRSTATGTFDSFSNRYTHYRASVETSNWHVFPIDNRAAWARMTIAGARALSFPPRLIAREPKR